LCAYSVPMLGKGQFKPLRKASPSSSIFSQ
jgi:hypothetical protein